MTTSWNFSVSNLESAQIYLYRYVGPVFVIAGIISCILSLIIFGRKNLRKSTCSIYFIAFNIANLFLILFSLLSFTLEIGYNIDPALHSLVYCRLRQYFAFLFDTLCPLFLLFASIDRVLVTSHNVRIRQKSTHRSAYIICGMSTLFYALMQIHAVFFTSILQVTPDRLYCYIDPSVYFVVISYISLCKEILTPSLLAIFGCWSVKNIRNLHRIRVVPVSLLTGHRLPVNTSHSTHARDRQFVLMLLVDIIAYIIFNFMMPFSLIYEQIMQNQEKNIEQIDRILLVRNIAIFSVHIPFCINCYTHILVSKTFRNEVKNIFLRK